MIEFRKCPVIDGVAYATLEDAQKEGLLRLLAGDEANRSPELERIAHKLVTEADKVIDILTTDTSSRPKARKVNGGTKKRKPKPLPIIDASETAA